MVWLSKTKKLLKTGVKVKLHKLQSPKLECLFNFFLIWEFLFLFCKEILVQFHMYFRNFFCDKPSEKKIPSHFLRAFLLQMSFDLDLGVAKNFCRNHTPRKISSERNDLTFGPKKKTADKLVSATEHGWWFLFLKCRHTKWIG